MIRYLAALVSLFMIFFMFFWSNPVEYQSKTRKKPTSLSIGKALSDWFHQRAYPFKHISMDKITNSYKALEFNNLRISNFPGTWVPIGPKNFGGRTLTLAFNPQNSQTIYAGSAAGGLWRSYSGGIGVVAWNKVPVGFPVLGVAAIAINPIDTNEIYIGTGEVYNDMQTGTGFAVRTTRGSYGIGVLKSNDGGITWSKSIDWSLDSLRGVQDIIINPINPSTVFAATTEGTFRSYDSGLNWDLIHNIRMGTDLLMMPNDTSMIFVAAGNSFSANPGIYRSTDNGNSFTKLSNGLPSTYSGKAMIDVCDSSPNIMYASIGEQLTGLGLFRSNDTGLNWFQVNTTDFQTYQGWYSHDVTVNDLDPNDVVAAGIDVWKSLDGGINLNQVSYWYNWDFNATTVGGSEGPVDYVHADVHRMFRDPSDTYTIYLATDGGIFRSLDGGSTFEGCNGSYQTQQFYANFSCSSTDSLFAIGGLQDNATAVYEGNDGWRRVIGGDGLSTAIHSTDDQIVYGSSQYLNLRRSNNKAQSFNNTNVPDNNGSVNTCFAGPFALSVSNPSVLFAGRTKIYKSTNGGQSWSSTNSSNELDGNPVLVIEISKTNPDLVYAATAPVNIPQVGLFKTTNGGASWTNVSAGIPDRYIMDIAIDPIDNNIVYVTLGGFGTDHLYRTVDGGTSWMSWGTGLPDVPTNTITIDPLNNGIVYVGNDLGVFVSPDTGVTFQTFNNGLTDANLIMDISISPSNRKLRLATHGSGVFERDMIPLNATTISEVYLPVKVELFPNPSNDFINVNMSDRNQFQSMQIVNCKGEIVLGIQIVNQSNIVDVSSLSSGMYFIILESPLEKQIKKFIKL